MTISNSTRSCEEQFDLFCSAHSLGGILHHFNQLCAIAIQSPIGHPWNIYRQLHERLKSYWKASNLFNKLDERVQCAEYANQTACEGLNAVVIGSGPCGLRCAIELALLGARVVVIEKRDEFSRNNVLHIWPYLIDDLRALGAKMFFGKFCAGSIDHISIRTLQCILLKVALLFGVQVFPNTTYLGLIQPTSNPSLPLIGPTRVFLSTYSGDFPCTKPIDQANGVLSKQTSTVKSVQPVKSGKVSKTMPINSEFATTGWRVHLEPELSVLQNYEIDVLIGADGKRSCLEFPCKELRCRLAIAITANFVNHHTQAETEVEEISGVTSIFNQQFFAQLAADTGIDLENIVYYKDETHYFVMTAKKHSLLAKGVLRQDFDDSESLLNPHNIDGLTLQAYARETASYVTNGLLPRLDFALNSRGQPDVDVFDFTRMFAAEHSCRILERKQRLLMQCLVGDGLLEPFWPTGSGCALGFLSAMDAAWAVKLLASGLDPLHVIAQRESVYQRLSQTTSQNMPSSFTEYTLNPQTRYTRCNLNLFGRHQVLHLYDTDCEINVKSKSFLSVYKDANLIRQFQNHLKKQLTLSRSIPSSDKRPCCLGLLRWLQFSLSFYQSWDIVDCPLDLADKYFESGRELLCLIHLYRPDIIPELQKFFHCKNSETANPRALFRHRSASDLRPRPTLIRACGLFIEHFNVMFSDGTDDMTSTFPRTTADWNTYLGLVYHALASLKMTEPERPPANRAIHSPTKLGQRKLSPSPMQRTKLNGIRAPSPKTENIPVKQSKLNVVSAKRVSRENLPRSVEKGLLLKRRDELITTLNDPASTKRRIAVRSAVLNGSRIPVASQQSIRPSSSLHRSSTGGDVHRPETPVLMRSHSSHENQSSGIKPISVPESVARLFAPQKGSSFCYCCHKRLLMSDRQTAFDLFFHRQCFRCAECDTQLHPGKAVRVRASKGQLLDKFYCLTHSTVTDLGPPKAVKPQAGTADLSFVDRLKNGMFPFGDAKSCPTNGYLKHDVPKRPESSHPPRMNHPSPSLFPVRSALLTGLNGHQNDVMGVAKTKSFIHRSKLVGSDSSSSSPVRDSSVHAKRAIVGPSGDTKIGIRVDNAPGPDCYLAGHLGLPEVERRANWELNTTPAVLSAAIPEILGNMRSNRRCLFVQDDYFASSESEDPITSDAFAWSSRTSTRPRKPTKRRRHTDLIRQSKSPNPYGIPMVESDSSSTDASRLSLSGMNASHVVPNSQSDTLPIHHCRLEAKQRFCMEPPRPLTIDPKHFISTKNKERTIVNDLSDCSESVNSFDAPEFYQASLSSVFPHLDSSDTESRERYVCHGVQMSSYEHTPVDFAQPRFTDYPDPFSNPSGNVHITTLQWPVDNRVSYSVPPTSYPFAMLDDVKDIDSTSTITERSSTEPTPELEDSRLVDRAQPVSTTSNFVYRASATDGDYENVHLYDPELQRVRFVSRELLTTANQKPSSQVKSDSSDTSSADLNSVVRILPKKILSVSESVPHEMVIRAHPRRLRPLTGSLPQLSQLNQELRMLEATLIELNNSGFQDNHPFTFSNTVSGSKEFQVQSPHFIYPSSHKPPLPRSSSVNDKRRCISLSMPTSPPTLPRNPCNSSQFNGSTMVVRSSASAVVKDSHIKPNLPRSLSEPVVERCCGDASK